MSMVCLDSAVVVDSVYSCLGDSNGSATVIIYQAIPPIAWTLNGLAVADSDTIVTFDSLMVGAYTAIYTDSSGCIDSVKFNITNPPAPLSIDSCQHTDVSCIGDSDGTATAGVISNSAGTIHYLWKDTGGAIIDSVASISGLVPGIYVLTITDNCSNAVCSVTVGQPNPLSIVNCTATDVTCNGGSNGTVTAGTLSNVHGQVFYSWTDSNNVIVGDTTFVDSLPAGTYKLTVRDDCDTAECTVTVNEPGMLSMSACSHDDVVCKGTSTGSLFAGTLTNAVGAVTYTWRDSLGNIVGTTDTVNGLPSGNYELIVSDQCFSDSCDETISEPGQLSMSACTPSNTNCSGDSTGSVTAGTLTNSVGSITYTWRDSTNAIVGTTATVNSLPVGTYSLLVTDQCSSDTCTATIFEGLTLTLGPCSHTDVTCQGGNDGTASAGTIGNTFGVVTYSWTDSNLVVIDTTATITNLFPGTYTLTVTDDCGSVTCTQTIIEPSTSLSITGCSHTDAICVGDSSGSVIAGTVSDSSGALIYIWTNSLNDTVGNTPDVSGLPAGTYTLTVTDDCRSVTCSVTISDPVLTLSMASCTHTDVTCAGTNTGTVTAGAISNAVGTVNYLWTDSNGATIDTTAMVLNLPAGTYTLTVTDNCGMVTCSETITESASGIQLAGCTNTPVSCYGASTGSVSAGTVLNATGVINYDWKDNSGTTVGTTATVNNLPAGTYTLTATDDCGSVTCSQTITQPVSPLNMTSCTASNVSCFGGQNGTVTSGTILGAVGPVTYLWQNSINVTVGTTASVSSLPADFYTLTVTDNCGFINCQISINEPSPLVVDAPTYTDATCFGTSTGTIAAGTVTGGTGTVSYTWRNASNVVIGVQPTITNLPAGTYRLTVSDSCTSFSFTQVISQPPNPLSMSACLHSDAGCYGSLTGSVSAGAVTGAQGAISYAWEDSLGNLVGTTPILAGIPAGTYSLTVYTICGTLHCTQTISQFPELTMEPCTHTDACFGGSNGSVIAGNITGSVGLLNYEWRDTNNVVVGTTETVAGLSEGQYTLTVTDNCSSLSCMQEINVNDTITSDYSTTACDAYDLPWGPSVTVSGDYTHTYASSAGCDSIVTAHVFVDFNTSTFLSDSVQGSYVLPWGDTVTVSGVYSHTYFTPYGCDSVVTVDVIVTPIIIGIASPVPPPNAFFSIDGNSVRLVPYIREARLYNLQGKEVGLTDLAAGVYLLRVYHDDKVYTYKIGI